MNPTQTLILDIERDRWYKDSYGIEAVAKDEGNRLYGIIPWQSVQVIR